MTIVIRCLFDTCDLVQWTLEEVLAEINRDRSSEWVPYDETDWLEGWNEFVEGEFYTLVDWYDDDTPTVEEK